MTVLAIPRFDPCIQYETLLVTRGRRRAGETFPLYPI